MLVQLSICGGIISKICSISLVAFLCSSHLVFFLNTFCNVNKVTEIMILLFFLTGIFLPPNFNCFSSQFFFIVICNSVKNNTSSET